MSQSRNRQNLLAPVEPARETAAVAVTFEPGPDCPPNFQVFFGGGAISLTIYDIVNK
jgi:hypothetical protein